MNQRHVVLTAVGPDRPGIVKAFSGAIHAAGCNLEDSRMAVLAGEFALILLFSGPIEAALQAERTTTALAESLEFRIALKDTRPPPAGPTQRRYRVRLAGADQPGIVHRIGDLLAGHGANIASLESRLTHAAFSGTPVFNLEAEIELPAAAAIATLVAQLEGLGDELALQIDLDPLDQGFLG